MNLTKVHIPQADEQQRLLANLITVMARDRMPMPRFWYFPKTYKAVLVATGDDHAGGGTAGRMSTYAAASPPGCSVALWECAAVHVLRLPGLAADQQPGGVVQQPGLRDRGAPAERLHQLLVAGEPAVDVRPTSWPPGRSKYTSVPSPTTSRYHCIVWSDWVSQPKAELASGIRLDTNYYY